MEKPTIVLASDHAGVSLKAGILDYLAGRGFPVIDEGPATEDSVDYPDFAARLCRRILEGRARFGVVICGSGIGISMSANRFRGIRAALCCDIERVRLSRRHNDANVLAFGARFIDRETACSMLDVFLETSFDGGRHERRVKKIDEVCGATKSA